jgi:hypothetical protein
LQDPLSIGRNLADAEEVLRFVLAYRAWFDQRRAWRYTNPNLEELGLLVPQDDSERVVQGARHVSPFPGDRMQAARLGAHAVVLR